MVDPPGMKATVLLACLIAGCLTLELPVVTGAGSTSGTDIPLPDGPPWTDLGQPPDPPAPDPLPDPPPGTTGPGGSSSASGDAETAGTDTGLPPTPFALRITELMPDPDGKDGGPRSPEFVELLNPLAEPMALDGLVLRAPSWPTVTARSLGLEGRSLASGGVLVVQRYAEAADAPPTVERGDTLWASFSSGSGLRNADGAAGVEDELGQWADLVVYGAPQPAPHDDPSAWPGEPAPTPAAGSSLCRVDPTVDDDDPADWAACAPSPGVAEPLPPPPPPAEAKLVIVEVLANAPGPSSEEKLLEFVEVLNLGPDPIDMSAFTIADDIAVDATGIDPLLYHQGDGGCGGPPTCLAAGARAIIVGNTYAGATGDALVLATDDTTLANAGLTSLEPVVLRDGRGEIRSTYRVWPDPSVAPDPTTNEQSLVRVDPGADDEPTSWTFAEPSPGVP